MHVLSYYDVIVPSGLPFITSMSIPVDGEGGAVEWVKH